jgi:hypothetical protein
VGVIAVVFVLAGCQHELTLEEAQALCTKQGGFLVVFYSQKITTSGIGPQIATPGNCMSPSKFDIAPSASTAPVPTAPASAKPPAPAN